MRKHYLTHPRVLLLVIGLLVISTFTRRQTASAIAYLPRNLVQTIANPFAQPLHDLSASVRQPSPVNKVRIEHDQLMRDYYDALASNERLRQQLDRANKHIDDLSRIRKLVPELRGKSLLLSNVTGWTGGAAPSLTINRGTRHGIQRGQAVAFEANLVGRISHVEPNSATVSLVTTAGLLLDARVLPPISEESPRQALMQLQPVRGKELFIAEIGHDQPVSEGDLAHLYPSDAVGDRETYWPDEAAGLILGQVVEIAAHPDDPQLRRHVYIRPNRSLKHLTRVVVLVPEQ